MGQYWQVACPDRQQQLTTLAWGKLGCILPDGYAGYHLQQQLMVPMRKQKDFPCGKNIRETEIKSKLRDYLADLEGNTKGDSPQTEEDTKEDPSSLLIDIYIRTRFPEGDCPPIGDYLSQRDIPALVEMLFDNLLGAWVNERIICVGDYSDTLPPEYQSASKTLYDTSYTEVLSLSDCAKQFLENLKSDSDKAGAFRVEYSRLLEESFPSDQQHVLLNLTSREYVFGKCNSVKELDPDRNSWSLGDAAMSRICWSQDTSVSMNYDGSDLVQGQWAGHRFKIIPISMLDEITKGKQDWRDASEEVYQVLHAIRKAEGN